MWERVRGGKPNGTNVFISHQDTSSAVKNFQTSQQFSINALSAMKSIAVSSSTETYPWDKYSISKIQPPMEDSPYKRALVSLKPSPYTSSDDGSPVSVLSGSRNKALLLDSSEKAFSKPRSDMECDWSTNWAANFGLTAGAAAPVPWSDSKLELAEALSLESEPESEPESTISSESTEFNVMEMENVAMKPLMATPISTPLLPNPMVHERSLLGTPAIITPPNLPLLNTPVRKSSFTPNHMASSFVPSKTPEASCTSPAASSDAVRKLTLGTNKEPGTGVFLPMKFCSSAKGKKASEDGVTTVLLPSRLVETLGIKIDPETSAVIPKFVSKKQGQQHRKIVRQYKYECRYLSPDRNERLWNPIDEFTPLSLLPVFIPMPVHAPNMAPMSNSVPEPVIVPPPAPEEVQPVKAPLVTYTLVDRSDEYPNLPDEWVY